MNRDPDRLYEEAIEGSRPALGRLLTIVENDLGASMGLLGDASRRASSAGTIFMGITGPAGSGKSTLLDAVITARTGRGRGIAVIAVDPTSPRTGGAVLGDRIRSSSRDEASFFFRSVASRGGGGGLAPSTYRLAVVLAAAGYGEVFIETVGAGQADLDIASLADLCIVTVPSHGGDIVQALKAGLLEAADVIAVTKSDLGGGERQARALAEGVGGDVRIVVTSARDGTGIEELSSEIDEVIAGNRESGRLEEKRRLRAVSEFERAAAETAIRRLERSEAYKRARRAVEEGNSGPYAALEGIA